MSDLGKLLLFGGAILAGVALLMLLGGRIGTFGRLPGDLMIERNNLAFNFPVVTCLVVSDVLTLNLWIINGRR